MGRQLDRRIWQIAYPPDSRDSTGHSSGHIAVDAVRIELYGRIALDLLSIRFSPLDLPNNLRNKFRGNVLIAPSVPANHLL